MISVLKALLLSIALGCAGAGTIAAPDGPAVAVGNTVFEVEIADTPQLRSKGLSGRETVWRTCPECSSYSSRVEPATSG